MKELVVNSFACGVCMMQAYDVNRKRIVNVERSEGNVIIAYSLPEQPGEWYFPLIENGKNVEPYEILETEQTSMF